MQTLFNILKSDKLQTTSNNNASSVIVHAAVSRLNAALLQLLRMACRSCFFTFLPVFIVVDAFALADD